MELPAKGLVVLGPAKVKDLLPTTPAEAVVSTALRRFKSLAETGEVPTLDRNPAGRGQTDPEPR